MKKSIISRLYASIFPLLLCGTISIPTSVYADSAPFTVTNRTGEKIEVFVGQGYSEGDAIKNVRSVKSDGSIVGGADVRGSGAYNFWRIQYRPAGWSQVVFVADKECEVRSGDVSGIQIYIDGSRYLINMPSGGCEGDFGFNMARVL